MVVHPAAAHAASATSSQPEYLGRFQILRQLGSGSQSVVYLALDPQLQREVAIKALRGAASTAEALLNEARAVGRLSHPGIVPVFEVGEAHPGQANATQGGRTGAYLVFEYVPGPTLADVLQEQGALAPALAVRMLLPALEAVAYAHSCGVIHRDLKPSNIVLDRRGISRVMDFGIAAHGAALKAEPVHVSTDDDPDALGSTALMGTPAYMAPEYAQDGRSTPQMDVFSAGLVLYELLVGHRAAPDDMGYKAVLYLMHQDVRLPDVLAHPVDEGLRAIVHQAVARECSARFATMDAMVDALLAWQLQLAVQPQRGPVRPLGATPLPGSMPMARQVPKQIAPATPPTVATPITGAPKAAQPTASNEWAATTPVRPRPTAVQTVTQTGADIETPLRVAVLQEKRALDKLRLLLRRVQSQRDYPLLPSTVGQVLPLASSDRQKVAVLADAVMGDTALSLKLMRMVNSSLYSAMGQGAVSAISTAIQLLGYAAVRSTATGMAAMTGQKDTVLRSRLLDDSLLAVWCGCMASELSGLRDRDAEEAYLCGSLQWLGPMLVSHCFLPEAQLIDRYAPLGGQAPLGLSDQHPVLSGHRERAARHVLGISMERLASGAARQWGLPDILVQSLYALGQSDDGEPTGVIAITRTRAEYLRALGNCARELVHAWMQPDPVREAAGVEQVTQRYATCLGLTSAGVHHAIQLATQLVKHQLQAQTQALRADMPASLLAQRLGLVARPTLPRLGQATHAADTLAVTAVPPQPGQGSAGAVHSLSLLTQGIQRLALLISQDGADLNKLLRSLLDTLQEATGFERVLLVLREPKGPQMFGRLAVGPMVQPEPSAFRLSMNQAADSFVAAVREPRDVWVPDASREGKRPSWHVERFNAGCYLLLPLIHNGQAMGLIYADHTRPRGVVLTDRVLAQLGTLRDQAVLAFRRHAVH